MVFFSPYDQPRKPGTMVSVFSLPLCAGLLPVDSDTVYVLCVAVH